MATSLGVSSAYLSALEHGNRGAPSWIFVQRVIAYFNLIWDEAEEIHRLAEISHPKVYIDTAGLDPIATEFANFLSRSISDIDSADLAELLLIARKAAAKET
jgi:transcriptional regulator with XRE-family HTH domain